MNHRFHISFVTVVLLWSRVALLFEAMLAWLYPAILFPAIYLALALFGVFEALGDPWRLLLAGFSTIGFLWFIYKNRSSLRWPKRKHVEQRAETDGDLSAGTLVSLREQPETTQTPASAALWLAHQTKTQQALASLRIRPLQAVLAAKDIWALRVLVVLALFAGLVFAGASWQLRVSNAFYPGLLLANGNTATIEAWINPPEYASLPPIFLTNDQAANISALAGSEFVVRVSAAKRAPNLFLPGAAITKQKLIKLGDGIYEGRAVLDGASTVFLSGGVKQEWRIEQKKDLLPKIEFLGESTVNASDEVGFSILAVDDFGVQTVWLLLETNVPGNFNKTDQIELVLPKTKKLAEEIELDLTRHILAGLPVTMRLQAIDGAGQRATSKPKQMVLPEKLLIKPLAKAIAEQRLLVMRAMEPYAHSQNAAQGQPVMIGNDRLLTERPLARLSKAPAKIQRAAALMRSVMRAPQAGIKDPFIWIGLSYVQERMTKAHQRSDLFGLEAEMWEISLRAEGGELESAAAAMSLAEKALQNALLLAAEPSELHRLSQKYEMAVKRYLQALAKAALQDESGQGAGAGNAMSGDQLQEMLDALRALAETGATSDARALLKALAAMLQNLRMQMAAGGQGDTNPDDAIAEAMRKALEELGEMLGHQREILDQTQQQQNRDGSNSTPANGGTQSDNGQRAQMSNGFTELAEQQGALKGNLNQLGASSALDDSAAKAKLDEAELAMKETQTALQNEESETALATGQKAFGQLREGAETLAEELFARREGRDQNGTRDPFGRQSNSGSQSAEGTVVPDMIDPQQARKILLELRHRAKQQHRPKEELEYLDRLLERF